jgi:tetratricopeptide (TPR) repeat protein
MNAEVIVAWLNQLLLERTGKGLSDLEQMILEQVWQGVKYLDIADHYGCTEGHVKDVSSALWHRLSLELGTKIAKTNFRSAISHSYQTSSPISHTPTISPALSPVTAFMGRTPAMTHLTQLIQQGAKVIVIQGEGGVGKTTLAQQYLQAQGFDRVLELLMAKETQNIVSAERVVEEWLQQDFGVEPGTEFGVSLARLKRQLDQQRVGILLDNLEPALDAQGRLVSQHRSYIEILRILADARVQAVTLITSRDRLCESSLNVTHYRLPGLDLEAWQTYFQRQGLSIPVVQHAVLQNLHHAYGGNAKAMGVLCGVIQTDFDNDLAAYWQDHQDDLLVAADLKDLVANQVDRLQALDPFAYRLFCRLGCYRYQGIPTLPIQALASMLWDVSAIEHRQVIASLRNRSLVEYHQGEYWLHPVMRAEAVWRLRGDSADKGGSSEREWDIAHRQGADFWTQTIQSIETTQDALWALEAYYHYIDIQDFEAAGRILLKSRNNQWKQYLPLGSTLYRMGLIQPVIAAITQVVGNLQIDHQLSELYNILGDVWWIAGEIHEAIACQEKTIALVTPALESLPDIPDNKHMIYYLKMLAIDSLLSIGLYRVDLWELAAAADLFEQVIQQSHHTDHHRWAQKASICLAWVQSYLGLAQPMDNLANPMLIPQPEQQGGQFAYFTQILGQTYINLGQLHPAISLLETALTFAETGHYQQIQARILTSMAAIHRHWHNFEHAIACHTQSIDLLERIGAKCDLAEALFQQGLTYQALGEADSSQANFTQSLQLFTTIQAPHQVEKVRLAMGDAIHSRQE